MPTIDEQLRFFAVKVNNGSGCIFQPDTTEYTYVLTVKHNLVKEGKSICVPDEIIIKRFNLDGDKIKIRDVYIHANIDIALLVVEYLGNENYTLSYTNPKRYEKVRVFGYPEYLKTQPIHTTSIICSSDLEHDPSVSFEIITDDTMHTFNRGAQQNIVGFSGSGIFFENGEQLILKGIFPRLIDPEGAHNKVNGIYISCFDEIIKNNNLLELIPSCLTSFEFHRDKAFDTINPAIMNCVSDHIKNILDSGITPKSVSGEFKGELCMPYDMNYQNKITNPKLWKSWLELLVYLDISTDNPDYSFNVFCRNIKLYHSENYHIMDQFVGVFLQDQELISKIKNNDIIAYSSENTPAGSKYLEKGRINKIVSNIYKQRSIDPRIKIDDPSKMKTFSCIHIEHFADKIAGIDSELLPLEIKEIIKTEIKNIFNYGNN